MLQNFILCIKIDLLRNLCHSKYCKQKQKAKIDHGTNDASGTLSSQTIFWKNPTITEIFWKNEGGKNVSKIRFWAKQIWHNCIKHLRIKKYYAYSDSHVI